MVRSRIECGSSATCRLTHHSLRASRMSGALYVACYINISIRVDGKYVATASFKTNEMRNYVMTRYCTVDVVLKEPNFTLGAHSDSRGT